MLALDVVLTADLFHGVEQEGQTFGVVFYGERFLEHLARSITA